MIRFGKSLAVCILVIIMAVIVGCGGATESSEGIITSENIQKFLLNYSISQKRRLKATLLVRLQK